MAKHSLFPSILPDGEEDFVDDAYHRSELEDMEWDALRQVAAEHPSDAVNGKSEREAIVDALTGEERV